MESKFIQNDEISPRAAAASPHWATRNIVNRVVLHRFFFSML